MSKRYAEKALYFYRQGDKAIARQYWQLALLKLKINALSATKKAA